MVRCSRLLVIWCSSACWSTTAEQRAGIRVVSATIEKDRKGITRREDEKSSILHAEPTAHDKKQVRREDTKNEDHLVNVAVSLGRERKRSARKEDTRQRILLAPSTTRSILDRKKRVAREEVKGWRVLADGDVREVQDKKSMVRTGDFKTSHGDVTTAAPLAATTLAGTTGSPVETVVRLTTTTITSSVTGGSEESDSSLILLVFFAIVLIGALIWMSTFVFGLLISGSRSNVQRTRTTISTDFKKDHQKAASSLGSTSDEDKTNSKTQPRGSPRGSPRGPAAMGGPRYQERLLGQEEQDDDDDDDHNSEQPARDRRGARDRLAQPTRSEKPTPVAGGMSEGDRVSRFRSENDFGNKTQLPGSSPTAEKTKPRSTVTGAFRPRLSVDDARPQAHS